MNIESYYPNQHLMSNISFLISDTLFQNPPGLLTEHASHFYIYPERSFTVYART